MQNWVGCSALNQFVMKFRGSVRLWNCWKTFAPTKSPDSKTRSSVKCAHGNVKKLLRLLFICHDIINFLCNSAVDIIHRNGRLWGHFVHPATLAYVSDPAFDPSRRRFYPSGGTGSGVRRARRSQGRRASDRFRPPMRLKQPSPFFFPFPPPSP